MWFVFICSLKLFPVSVADGAGVDSVFFDVSCYAWEVKDVRALRSENCFSFASFDSVCADSTGGLQREIRKKVRRKLKMNIERT